MICARCDKEFDDGKYSAYCVHCQHYYCFDCSTIHQSIVDELRNSVIGWNYKDERENK